MKTKLFISNADIVDQQFLDFCDLKEIELVAKSLIDFRAVDYTSSFDTDVVFFSSPRAVDFFLPAIKHKGFQLACLGSGTANRLKEYGYDADFVGSNSGEPSIVSREFQLWLGDRKALFPLSTISNRSISSNIPENQKLELVVYETVSASESIEPCDLYVFTSPSNVFAFLEKNIFPENARVIAWGKATERKLKELNFYPEITLRNSSLRDLEQALAL